MGRHHIGPTVDIFDSRIAGFSSVTPNNPDTGSALHWKNPFQGRILLISARFTFQTSASVVERLVIIRGVDGNGQFGFSPAPGVQTENSTVVYNFAPCALGVDRSENTNFMTASLSPWIYLDRDQHLEIDAAALQSGDVISAIDLRFLRTAPF